MKPQKIAAQITLGVVVTTSLALAAPALAHHRADHSGGQPSTSPTDETTTAPPNSPEPSGSPATIPTVPPLPKPTVPPLGSDDPNCIPNALYAANPIKGGGMGPALNPFAPISGALMLVRCV